MVTVRLPDELRDRIDAVRGGVPRERWVREVLEERLDEVEPPSPEVRALTEGKSLWEATRILQAELNRRNATFRSAVEATLESDDPPAEVPLPKIAPRRWAK